MTRPAELRDLPTEELKTRLESAKEELFNLRFQLATGQLDNPMRIKQVRHDVARIFTVLREQEVEVPESEDEAEGLVKAEIRRRRFGRRRAERAEQQDQEEAPASAEGAEEEQS